MASSCIPRSVRSFIVLACLAFGLSAPALSQVDIYIQATAKDPVGRQIAYSLREGIRRSAAMNLADREKDGRIMIRLVTMDPEDGASAGRQTIYSAVFTMQTFHDTPVEMYITNYVGICGQNKADSCAQGLVAIADEKSSELRSMVKDVLEKSRRK